jgi:hypothetical protein
MRRIDQYNPEPIDSFKFDFCFLFYQEKRENQTRTIERRFTNEYYQTKPFNSFHEILKMNQYFKYQKKNISFNA